MTAKTMSPLVEQQFKASAKARRKEVLIDNMLTESLGLTQMNVLEEAKGAPGVLIVEGKVGQCGVPTANKRLYERRIMEREIRKLQEKIERAGNLAAVDHPGDGKSRIMEAGAICRGLRIESDGSIIGRYEVVEESDGGRNLAAFLRRGAAVGMSSRGIGSTSLNSEGFHVVGEDFKLHAFDFVADPACKDAYPALVSEDLDVDTVDENHLRVTFPSLVESIETRARQQAAMVVEQDVREQVEEEYKRALDEAREQLHDDIKLQVVAEVREQLREDFAAKLLQSLQHQRAQVEEVVRSELLSDPSVAGARKFMEDLAERLVPYRPSPDQKALMDSSKEEIEGLKTQVEHLQDVLQGAQALQVETEKQARSLGYRLFVERSIQPYEHADQMREMIGDVDSYETVDELRDRVSAVVRQVESSHEEARDLADQKVKVAEHKTELAQRKAKIANSQVDQLRTEMTEKFERIAEKFQSQIREKDTMLSDALDAIDHLERQAASAERAAKQARMEAEEADLVAYTTRRTVGHPRRDDIMAAVASGRVTTKDGVKQLAESWDHQAHEPGGVGERIRRAMGRGREAPTEDDQQRIVQLQEDRAPLPGFEGFDTTMGELRALAGINQNINGRRRF